MGIQHSSHLYDAIAKDPRHHENQVKALWKHYDTDNDGKIHGEEVGKFTKELLEHLMKLNNGEDPELDMAELKEDSLTYETFKNLLAKEFDRFNPQPESKRKLAQASEYRAMAQALVGTWIGVSNGESGPDVLQVASLPHNTIYFIRDFSLCAHANLQETLTFKEPIPWKNDAGCDFLSVEYQQTIYDTQPELVHEEVGMFLFNLQDGTISRHAAIPHGTTFVMSGALYWEDGKAPQVPKTLTLPLANPDFEVEVKGAFISNTLTAGLERGRAFANTNIPVSNPAMLLQDANHGQDYGDVMVYDFPETKTLDLPFVDNFSRGEKKCIKKASSTWWTFKDGDQEHLQYIQTINFDFPINVPLITPGLFREDENLRWPHVIVARLTKQKPAVK